jgi:inorganic triphosphatase YgiF
MGPALEEELRFRAETDEPLDRLAQASHLGGAALGQAVTAEVTDAYLDTADHRLAAMGWACRLRQRGGTTLVSLKGPSQHQAGDPLHRRPELEGPGGPLDDPGGWPESEARDWLLRAVEGSGLEVRLTLEQQRTEREVTLHGQRVGLMSLDRVVVVDAGRELGRLRIVEVELEPAAMAVGLDTAPLAAALGAVPGLAPDPESKYARSLALLATGPSRPAAGAG